MKKSEVREIVETAEEILNRQIAMRAHNERKKRNAQLRANRECAIERHPAATSGLLSAVDERRARNARRRQRRNRQGRR